MTDLITTPAEIQRLAAAMAHNVWTLYYLNADGLRPEPDSVQNLLKIHLSNDES